MDNESEAGKERKQEETDSRTLLTRILHTLLRIESHLAHDRAKKPKA